MSEPIRKFTEEIVPVETECSACGETVSLNVLVVDRSVSDCPRCGHKNEGPPADAMLRATDHWLKGVRKRVGEEVARN